MTQDEIITDVLTQMESRYRFSKMDNLLENPPIEEEYSASILDTVGEINSQPPQTLLSLDGMYSNSDSRYKVLLYLGSAKNICLMLLTHWTAEGFSGRIDDLEAEDKRGSYESLLSTLTESFNDRLEKFKNASQKICKGRTASGPNAGALYPGNRFNRRIL